MRGFYFIVLFLVSLPIVNVNAQRWMWSKGNRGSGIEAWPVATDHQGNVIIAGYKFQKKQTYLSFLNVPFSDNIAEQCLVAKYNPSGIIQWVISSKIGDLKLITLTTDVYGNVYVFGKSYDPSFQIGSFVVYNPVMPKDQLIIIKIDPDGNVLWVKNHENFNNPSSVFTDLAGNSYVTGDFSGSQRTIGSTILKNTDETGITSDIFIAKFNPNGDFITAFAIGGIKSDNADNITVTPTGDIYISGLYSSPEILLGPITLSNPAGSRYSFIARFNSSFQPIWAYSSSSTKTIIADIGSDIYSNFYAQINSSDVDFSIADNTVLNPIPGGPALFLLKLNSENSLQWKKIISPAYGRKMATSLCNVWITFVTDSFDTVDSSGFTKIDSANIEGNIIYPSYGSIDPIFFAGFDVNGTMVGSGVIPSGGDDWNGIACDDIGNLFFCGDYISTSPFILGSDTLPVDSSAQELLCISKYETGIVPKIDYVIDTECLDHAVMLNSPTGYSNTYWNDGYIGLSRTIKDTGTYIGFGLESCRSSTIEVHKILDCNCGKALFMPNSFTPNGDGQNDVYYPRAGFGINKIKSFQVYNRWGELLHERSNFAPNDKSKAWDGTYQGQVALPEVYVYVVEVLCESGSVIFKKGSVTVIR